MAIFLNAPSFSRRGRREHCSWQISSEESPVPADGAHGPIGSYTSPSMNICFCSSHPLTGLGGSHLHTEPPLCIYMLNTVHTTCIISAEWPLCGGAPGAHRHGVVEAVVVDAGTQRVVEQAAFEQLQGLRHLLVEVVSGFIRTRKVEIVRVQPVNKINRFSPPASGRKITAFRRK